MHDVARTGAARPAERFHRACEAVVARLPFGLNTVVAPTFLGFAVINSGTFGVDLLLLTLLHGGLRWPVPIAVTLAYVCAFALSYVLNRTLNFRSHSAVGPQIAVYVGVVVVNYLAFILGVSAVLAALGVEYHLARLAAGACEAVYMYCAMRWVVFRRAG
ncbi:GtrA family protein [Nocardia sp. NEAU-G5]|uniref:GtrA family protein n=1 Tax=Nocardia albiluteola TaxID=2842303 RepID=A0ABS6AYS9_9NOCA|nr:GtrA family protein [Nocardia albiluteola]MBU3062173.1 GtrA family protein [Nocardia albiluteola]